MSNPVRARSLAMWCCRKKVTKNLLRKSVLKRWPLKTQVANTPSINNKHVLLLMGSQISVPRISRNIFNTQLHTKIIERN